MKIIFAGTPEFAVPFLEALLKSEHQVLAIYTKIDKPAGRGLKLTASPIKECALKHQIQLYQPVTFKDTETQQQLKNLGADIFIDVAYGLLLPKTVLTATPSGCVNVHPSLLPRWRGAAPIPRAILAGDTVTGVSIMQLDEGLDTGDIYQQASFAIENTDTSATLFSKTIQIGIPLLLDTLKKIANGTATLTKQNAAEQTYANKITKDEAKINWHRSAIEIDRMIRAFNPWPIAYSEISGKNIRIWQAIPLLQTTTQPPGTIIATSDSGLDVATHNGIIRLQQIQLPGGKVLPVKEILKAQHKLFTSNTRFD
jgi:methionyl-tRNA formyltransferase